MNVFFYYNSSRNLNNLVSTSKEITLEISKLSFCTKMFKLSWKKLYYPPKVQICPRANSELDLLKYSLKGMQFKMDAKVELAVQKWFRTYSQKFYMHEMSRVVCR